MNNTVDEMKFWEAVFLCLTELHGYSQDQAKAAVIELEMALDDRGPGVREIALHDEPFTVACEISGKDLDLDFYSDRYEKILERVAG